MNVRKAVTTVASVLLGAAMLATSAVPAAASATQGAGGGKVVLAPHRLSLSMSVA